ncbi:MAG TPA: LPS export ABC transporter periplasmic protein LptC [candidate division Zixibacteria bacterium]|nr:LPS export ABC transporter periplasmic protein LptC [candidate division Zixibacteria bacterium]
MKTLPACCLILAIFVFSCQRKTPDSLPHSTPSEPDEVLFNSTITLTSRGTLTSQIKADRILRYAGQEPMFLYSINALFYDSAGKEQARVTADSGSAIERTRYVELRGNVKVLYSSGTEIDADSLKWDQVNDRVMTEGFVKITKKDGSILGGRGLTTDPHFTSYRLKDPVGEVEVPKEEAK